MRQPDTSHVDPRFEAPETARAQTAGALATTVPLGGGRSVEVRPMGDDQAVIRVRGQRDQQLQIEIRFEPSGPVVRVAAPELQLEGVQQVVASCDTFKVDARERIELRSGGEIVQQAAGTSRVEARRIEMDASPGAIRLKANDEVQLKGELILLNCDHPSMAKPLPEWAAGAALIRSAAPAAATSGDPSVIAELLQDSRDLEDE